MDNKKDLEFSNSQMDSGFDSYQAESMNSSSMEPLHSQNIKSAQFMDAKTTTHQPIRATFLDASASSLRTDRSLRTHSARPKDSDITDSTNSMRKMTISEETFDSGLGSLQQDSQSLSSVTVQKPSLHSVSEEETSELSTSQISKLVWEDTDTDGDNDAMIAAAQGDDTFVQDATSICQKPNALVHNNLQHQTILHVAAMFCNYRTIRRLLTSGCDPSKKDIYGNTALHYAAQRGNADVVDALIREPESNELSHPNFEVPFKGSPSGCVNCFNHEGKAAIHLAAEQGHRKVLEVLSKARYVDVDQRRCTDGYSIAHIAISNEDMTLLEVCLEFGVDSEVRDFSGYTPMQMARNCGQEEMVELCKMKGASPHQLEYMDYSDDGFD